MAQIHVPTVDTSLFKIVQSKFITHTIFSVVKSNVLFCILYSTYKYAVDFLMSNLALMLGSCVGFSLEIG